MGDGEADGGVAGGVGGGGAGGVSAGEWGLGAERVHDHTAKEGQSGDGSRGAFGGVAEHGTEAIGDGAWWRIGRQSLTLFVAARWPDRWRPSQLFIAKARKCESAKKGQVMDQFTIPCLVRFSCFRPFGLSR